MQCPKCNQENLPQAVLCSRCAAPLAPADGEQFSSGSMGGPPLALVSEGNVILGKYKILRKIGAGGMGIVFEAQDLRLKRKVALKFLSSQLTSDPELKQRFWREAQAASRLDHQNICTIHEIDQDESGRVFIAMSFCPGESLKNRIASGPLPLKLAMEIAVQIAQGLSRAHQEGIVHRDIKPGNIIVSEKGDLKIVDFGLAKFSEGTEITQTAGLIGTVAYMSPEQIQGEPVDDSVDLWSLGVVLYEMLTGERPFGGPNYQAVLNSILNKPPVPPGDLRPDIPLELEKLVLKALNKNKKDRYASAKYLLAELLRVKKSLVGENVEPDVDIKIKAEVRKETERRRATVMFAKISGLTALWEAVEPQEASAVMRRGLNLYKIIEEKYGGRIEMMTETSFRISFGADKAVENAVEKAVNAAIAFRNQVEQFGRAERLFPPPRVQIGMNSGPVIVGAAGPDEKSEYSLLGETVDLASLLQDVSKEGMIVVGPATYRETSKEFDYRPLKPILWSGKGQVVQAYELLSVAEKLPQPRRGAERIISSDLVGREKELDRLQLHLLKAMNGEGSIVNVIGEAGIGKSRLIAEFREKSLAKKVFLLEGRALPIGQNLSFYPIIGILKNWAGIKEDDGPQESVLKFEQTVRMIDPENADEIFPFLATLMGMKLAGKHAERMKGIEGEALEKLILKSAREMVEKAASQRTLVFILEDLHWADQSSLRLLESLFRLAEKNGILFINSFRPDHDETSGRLLETMKYRYGHLHTNLVLEPLDERLSGILIQNLLKTDVLPVAVRDTITRRAEGNPLFIEEVARSFIDDGVLEMRDGQFHVTEKIDSVVIPETVLELLTARIDKLDEETKSLLKVASVIGRSFLRRVLLQVAPSGEDTDRKLDFLKDAQLIQERRSAEEVEYLFKHALIQQAAYESLLPKKRQELHLKIAAAIEMTFGERVREFCGMLAYHYSRGEDLTRAEGYLIKAGEEALRSSASNEALHFYREALRIYSGRHGRAGDPMKIGMLEKNIGIALYNRGHLVEAAEHFEKAMAAYGQKTPPAAAAAALKFLNGFLNFMVAIHLPSLKFRKTPGARARELIDLLQRKMSALSVTIPKRMFIESFSFCPLIVNHDLTGVENGLGWLTLYSTVLAWPAISFRLSRRILAHVEDKIDRADVKAALSFVFARLVHDFFTGQWEKVETYEEHLIEQSLKIGEFFYTTNYLAFLCHLKVCQGELEVAQRIIDKVDEISQVYEHDYARTQKHYLRSLFLLKTERYPEVLQETEAGIAFAEETGYVPPLFSLYAYRAYAQAGVGDIAGAAETLQKLEKIRTEQNVVPLYLNYYLRSHLLVNLLRLKRSGQSGSEAEKAELRRKALKSGQKLLRASRKLASERMENNRLMGTCLWLTGKPKPALKRWAKSIREGMKLNARLELAKTHAQVAERLAGIGKRDLRLCGFTSDEHRAKAVSIFKEINLKDSFNPWEHS